MSAFTFTKATKKAAKGRIALDGPSGSGKAQPVYAPVLAPAGWRQIGDLRPGDEVFAADGSVSHVVAVYPQGVQPIYRLTFSDGATAESTADHLWFTQTVLDRGATAKVAGVKASAPRAGSPKPLSEIAATLRDRHGKRNHWIPMCAPADFPENPTDLPLDPWLLGVILGDGGLRGRGAVVSKPGDELRREVSLRLPAGCRIGWDNGLTFGITGTTQGHNPVLDMLRQLGLHGLKSTQKYIPQAYCFASAKTRAAVLAGLLDTDGYASGHTCEFGTSSALLAEDVRFLVESLGGTATMSQREPSYRTSDGQRHAASPAWRLNICPPADVNPFFLRADRFTPRTKYPARRAIDSVSYVRDSNAVCIAIAHPSRLYVTSDFVVTHNTYTALTIASVLGRRTALIDTEHGSASKYADLFDFDTLGLHRYSPQILIDALAAAGTAGYDVMVVDSLSHFWMGTDGMLEQVDKAAKREGGHGMSGWKAMRPVERQMVEALLAYPGHVICTLRVKTDWVEGENARGKRQMMKVGTKAEQREGLEYEFDLVASMDLANELTVVKSRCPALSGEIVSKPGVGFAETFKKWLDDGEPAGPSTYDALTNQILDAGDKPLLTAVWKSIAAAVKSGQLTEMQGEALAVLWKERRDEIAPEHPGEQS